MKKIKILDVIFDAVSPEEALARIFERLHTSHEKFSVVTPNPEMLLEARKNSVFRGILNRSFLSIPDGIGILWASTFFEITKRDRSRFVIFWKAFFSLLSLLVYPKFCRKVFPSRVTGVDLFLEIVKRSAEKNLRIFLLGAKEGIAAKLQEKLEKTFPKVSLVGAFAGSSRNEDFKEIKEKIIVAKPDILFVAYGAPAQELWIALHVKEFPSVRMAMGVGGAFDFLAGVKKRAPKWMQQCGIEWLFRLIQEPSRIRRIYRAAVKFPCVIFWNVWKRGQ